MAGAWFVVGIFALAIITAALKVYVTYFMPRHVRFTEPAPRADYVNDAPRPADAGRVSPRPDAVMEMEPRAGNAEMVTLTQAALDGMIAAARAEGAHEAVARAVGTLTGAGFIAPDQRSKALLRLGIQGRRYTDLKPKVDAAQAAAQADLAPAEKAAEPPRVVKVYAGRPEARAISLEPEADDGPDMAPDESVAHPGPMEPLRA